MMLKILFDLSGEKLSLKLTYMVWHGVLTSSCNKDDENELVLWQ